MYPDDIGFFIPNITITYLAMLLEDVAKGNDITFMLLYKIPWFAFAAVIEQLHVEQLRILQLFTTIAWSTLR